MTIGVELATQEHLQADVFSVCVQTIVSNTYTEQQFSYSVNDELNYCFIHSSHAVLTTKHEVT